MYQPIRKGGKIHRSKKDRTQSFSSPVNIKQLGTEKSLSIDKPGTRIPDA